MRTRILLAGLTAACAHPESPPAEAGTPPPPAVDAPAPASWTVSPDRFGPVEIGWSLTQVNAALGDSIRATYQISDECDQLRPTRFPAGVSLMVERDTVVRFDVDTIGIRTPEGAGVGDTEDRLRELFGARAVTTPHKYTGPEGHYVTVRHSSDSTRFTIFETNGKTVERYRAGKAPAVEYVEGCA